MVELSLFSPEPLHLDKGHQSDDDISEAFNRLLLFLESLILHFQLILLLRIAFPREHELADRFTVLAYLHFDLVLPVLISRHSFDRLEKGISVPFLMPHQVVEQPVRVVREVASNHSLVLLELGLTLIHGNQIGIVLHIFNHDLVFIGWQCLREK